MKRAFVAALILLCSCGNEDSITVRITCYTGGVKIYDGYSANYSTRHTNSGYLVFKEFKTLKVVKIRADCLVVPYQHTADPDQ